MKLKYYMCGLGSGIILAVLVLMIANKITSAGNAVNNDINTQQTTGSVIAYTTQAEVKNSDASTTDAAVLESSTEDNTTQNSKTDNNIKNNEEGTSVTIESNKETETSKPQRPDSSGEAGNEKVSVHIDAVTVASDIARMLEDKGVIDSADEFIQYMYDNGYSRIIQEGDFELNKSDTYENVAKILTRQ